MSRKTTLPAYIDNDALKALSETFDTELSGVLPEILAHFPEEVEEKFYDTIPTNEDALKEAIARTAIAVVSANPRDKNLEETNLRKAVSGYLIARGVPEEMPADVNEHIQSVADDMIEEVQRRKREHQTARDSNYLKK